MGSGDSKLHFRKAVIQLTTKTQVGFWTCIVPTGSARDVWYRSVTSCLKNVTFCGENICWTYGMENLRDFKQTQVIIMRDKSIFSETKCKVNLEVKSSLHTDRMWSVAGAFRVALQNRVLSKHNNNPHYTKLNSLKRYASLYHWGQDKQGDSVILILFSPCPFKMIYQL